MTKVPLREGYPFAMTWQFKDGIAARYTTGKFVVRAEISTDSPVIVECDESSGLSIDHANGYVVISIGATRTDDLVAARGVACWCEVRLSNPDNDDDRIGAKAPVFLDPSNF